MRQEPSNDRVKAFIDSMVVDYEKWHDGVGYDIDLLAEMTHEERAQVESLLLSSPVSGWRDLEALDALGTSGAIDAIVQARSSADPEIRLAAQRYGPEPQSSVREAAILKALESKDLYGGLSEAIDEAAEHPTPRIENALLRIVSEMNGAEAYSAVAALYYIHGRIESPMGFENREFFLRLAEPDSDDRRAAVGQVCLELNMRLDPQG